MAAILFFSYQCFEFYFCFVWLLRNNWFLKRIPYVCQFNSFFSEMIFIGVIFPTQSLKVANLTLSFLWSMHNQMAHIIFCHLYWPKIDEFAIFSFILHHILLIKKMHFGILRLYFMASNELKNQRFSCRHKLGWKKKNNKNKSDSKL